MASVSKSYAVPEKEGNVFGVTFSDHDLFQLPKG